MRELGLGSRHIVENGLQTAGLRLQSLRIVMELDSTEAILSCTEEQPNDKRGERESEDNREVHLVKGRYDDRYMLGYTPFPLRQLGRNLAVSILRTLAYSPAVLCREVP
jgi:hypothetical protein